MPVIRFKTSAILVAIFAFTELLLLSLFYNKFPAHIPAHPVHFNGTKPNDYDEKVYAAISSVVDAVMTAIPLLVLFVRRGKLSPGAIILLNLFIILIGLSNLASLFKIIMLGLGTDLYKTGWVPFLIEKGAIGAGAILIFLLLRAMGQRNVK
ncbi:hypothetical protein [Taibaiella soli]|uniref:Uncharacterized protein n=1 Tax=Taibaiella soli TaxID=1649169 RepID=A0A2W2AFE7_9BACT|nr:hypothetical protein [Taibaiella soli]PZF70910.1 hypothetical protein DN068_21015 [Taibaiella soli]